MCFEEYQYPGVRATQGSKMLSTQVGSLTQRHIKGACAMCSHTNTAPRRY